MCLILKIYIALLLIFFFLYRFLIYFIIQNNKNKHFNLYCNQLYKKSIVTFIFKLRSKNLNEKKKSLKLKLLIAFKKKSLKKCDSRYFDLFYNFKAKDGKILYTANYFKETEKGPILQVRERRYDIEILRHYKSCFPKEFPY